MSPPESGFSGEESAWRPRLRLRKVVGRGFVGLCLVSMVVGLGMLGALVIDVSIDGAARLFAAPELSRSARYFGIGMAAIFPLIFLFRGLDRRAISVDRWVDPIWARRNRALAGLWWLPATILVRVPRALGRLPPIFIVLLITGWFVYLFLDQAFLTSFASRRPERAGIYAPLIGTLYMMVITAAVAFPLGVGAAIYLEEYARKNWFARMIQINIANLAGVPSIVYGLLGLQLFVRTMELDRSVLAGALTMALLVMPIIICECAGGVARGAAVDAGGSVRAGRDALADDPDQRAAVRVRGDDDGDDSGDVARDRRDGAAAGDRRADVRRLPTVVADRLVHDPSDPDLQLGVAATGGLPDDRGGGDSDAAAAATAAEQHGDHSAPAHAGALVAGRGAIRWWKLESVRKKPTTS